MDVIERYAVAVGRGRLHGRALEAVAGAGLVWERHRLGLQLQRLRAGSHSASDLAEVHAALQRMARAAVDRREVRREGQRTEAVVADVLAWWMAPGRPRARPVPRPEGTLAAWVTAALERAAAASEVRLGASAR